MGVMLSAAGSLQWLRDVAAPGVAFGELVESAAAWEPGVEGLTFLPYLAGERTPHADPDARGAFTGLSLRHDRGALTRAVLEGVAYGLRDSLDLLRELGVTPERGRVSGGGARSELWLRIIASVLELPLERPVVEEGAAYGAALLGGVAGGTWPDTAAAVAACVQVRGEVEPEPAWIAPYAEGRARFRALYPASSRGTSERSCGHELLQGPAVAVGVGEEHEAAPREVLDLGRPRRRAPTSAARAASVSSTTICRPSTEPGSTAAFRPLPIAIEHAEPGGVSCTKRISSLTAWSWSALKPTCRRRTPSPGRRRRPGPRSAPASSPPCSCASPFWVDSWLAKNLSN